MFILYWATFIRRLITIALFAPQLITLFHDVLWYPREIYHPKFDFQKKYKYSICISTFERPGLIVPLVKRLQLSIRPDTEIVIVDDASQNQEKKRELSSLSQYPNVHLFIHKENLGPFFAKLHGFQRATGDYVLSIDDDDSCDIGYHNEIIDHIEPQYDFISCQFGFHLKVSNSLEDWVANYPNHVYMAIRRSLFDQVEWPTSPLRIIQDDSPIVLVLFMQSTNQKIRVFRNKKKYLCPRTSFSHLTAVLSLPESQPFVLNGYHFIIKEAKRMGKHAYYRKYIDHHYRKTLPIPKERYESILPNVTNWEI